MQTLTRAYMVLIEDYDHMTLMDENMNWINRQYFL